MNTSFKLASVSSLAATLISANAATSVGYDFSSNSSGDLFTGGVSGWSQSNSNPFAFGQILPRAYISTSTNFGSGPGPTGHLGTQLTNTPDNSPTTVTGALGVSALDPVSPRLSLNLAILDDVLDNFPGRDDFKVALRDRSGQDMAVISLSPTVGDDLSWDVAVGVNGAAPTTTGAQVDVRAGYVFIVDFNSSSTSFFYGPSQGTTSPVLISNEAAVGNFGSRVAEIAMTHQPVAAVGTSANTLAFDDIEVSVPEPSSSLLIFAAAAFLGVRKRS
jgi:hypothetical protein